MSRDRPTTGSLGSRATIILCLLVAAGLFILSGFIAPDTQPTWNDLRVASALALITAAAPMMAWLVLPDRIGAVVGGGGMVIGGAINTPGGNLAGFVMVIAGLILLTAGRRHGPDWTARLVGASIGVGAALAVGGSGAAPQSLTRQSPPTR